MKLFEFKDNVGPGVSKNAQKAPAYVTFFKVFVENFAKLAGLNILYLFCCLPIFTIGPATAGFTYVLRNLSQRKHVDVLHDFIVKCKEHFKRGLIIGLIDIVITLLLLFSYNQWVGINITTSSTLRVIALVALIYFAYMFICANFYIFPMLVSFDLPLKKIIKNSLILAAAKLWRNIAMLAVNVIIIGACIVFWPIPLPIFLFIVFSFCGLFNNSMIFPVLVKHIAVVKSEKQDEDITEEDQVFRDPS